MLSELFRNHIKTGHDSYPLRHIRLKLIDTGYIAHPNIVSGVTSFIWILWSWQSKLERCVLASVFVEDTFWVIKSYMGKERESPFLYVTKRMIHPPVNTWLFVVLKLFVYVMSLLLDRLLKGRRHSPPPLFLQYLGHTRRTQWHPTPVFLPGESQGWWEPGGLPSMGSHRVGHDWSNLAAAQSTAPGAHNFKIFFFTWIQISFCRDQWVCICDCVWLPCLLSNKGDKLWVQK